MSFDFVNPIVVKEVRQGLKSRSFLAAFLGLQALMLLSMLIYFGSVTAPGGDLGFASGFFWAMIGIVLVFVMPVRSFWSIYSEHKGNTLEMLFLTRMSSWHISLGKWLALSLQVLLMVTAVLPYLVLRYFLGSINIASDLQAVYHLVMYSLLLMAVGAGMSAWQSKLLRIFILVGVGFFSLSVGQVFFFISLGVGGGGMGGGAMGFTAWDHVTSFVVAVLLMAWFVEYGASVIAPPAENHALPKRLIGTAIAAVLLLRFLATSNLVPAVLALLFLLPVCIDALCEPVPLVASLYRRRSRWGPLRVLVLPGWTTGVLFTALAVGVIFAAIFFVNPLGLMDHFALFGVSIFTGLVWPTAAVNLIFPRIQKWTPAYIAVQLGSFLVAAVLLGINEVMGHSDLTPLAALLPQSAMLVLASEPPRLHGGFLPPFVISTTGVLLLAGLAARRPLHAIHALKSTALPPASEVRKP